jgi:starch-binding outer membrane protein, SusD/RagB family
LKLDLIEKELKESVDKLSEDKVSTYAKMNKWGGYTLLAKLYLNAERYGAGAQWQKAADAASKVINSSAYILEPNYFANFRLANEGSKENIFVVTYDKQNAVGFIMRHQALHQSSPATFGFTAQPWGGFSVQTEFYNAYTADDKRKGMFIVGQQYTQAAEPQWSSEKGFLYGNPKDEFKLTNCNEDFNNLIDKTGEDCNVFISTTYTLKDGKAYKYEDGARYGKYEYDQNTAFDMPNDFAIFRYADVLLMRAEALWRLSNSSAEALVLVNQVRARAGVAALASLSENDLYWEIKKELALENHARPTTIRFGHYEDAWFLKTDTDPRKRLFPIPVGQIQANTKLVQNPGY